jgi:cytoskeleton protein RodZ
MSEAASIGEQLRAARERMGLGLVQAAERLHVDTAIISALESGQFSSLGAPVYVRGHLRRYAELLGEPDESLQQRYAALHEASVPPDLTAVPLRPVLPMRATKSRRWPLILLLTMLVVAAVAWWVMRTKPA